MSYKYYFTDYERDQHIKSDEAKTISLGDVIGIMNKVLTDPDNFVGLIDTNDVMLQFMVEESGDITVDIPLHERKGSFVKTTNLDEALAIVNALKSSIDAKAITGLEFKKWGK